MKIQGKPASQRGSTLLEALIAILLFSMGILALMGLQAGALKNMADAKSRTEAAFLANQIIGQMWAEVPANLAAYAHNPTTAGTCLFTGGASTNDKVTAWLGNASTSGTVAGNLPGASSDKQQIAIGAGNLVTVTICWQGPREAAPHNYVAVAQVNNN